MSALDEILSDKPVHLETKKTMNAARAELTALRIRADAEQYWHQTAEQERRNAAKQRERAEGLRVKAEEYDRIAQLVDPNHAQSISIHNQIVNLLHDDSAAAIVAEQARRIDEARRLLTTLDWNDWCDEVDAWLFATAPEPQDAQEKPE